MHGRMHWRNFGTYKWGLTACVAFSGRVEGAMQLNLIFNFVVFMIFMVDLYLYMSEIIVHVNIFRKCVQ